MSHALLDTRAANFFIPSTISIISVYNHYIGNPKPRKTMTHTVIKKLPVYNLELFFIDKQYGINTKATTMNRPVLTILKDPHVK